MKKKLNIDTLKKIILNKEVEGFEFKSTSNCNYISDMDFYIGKKAKITNIFEIDQDNSTCQLTFEDGEYWSYPTVGVFSLFFNEVNLEEEEIIELTKKELFNIILYATQKVNLNKEITFQEVSELELYDKNKLFLEELLKEIKE